MSANSFSQNQHSSISSLHSIGAERVALTTLAQEIARNAVELLHLDDCALAVLDDAGASIVFLLPEDGTAADPFPLDREPLRTLAADRTPLVRHDTALNARLCPLSGETSNLLIGLPLVRHEELLGVLLASAKEPRTLAPAELRTLTLLAEQAALAVHNARQAELVRDAGRMKAKFLSLVTHELRSPFNTINGYLDLVLEGIAGELSAQQHEFVRRARAGSEHLYALFEDLLLVARADADQLRLNLVPLSLEELVQGALEELEMTTLDSQIRLETALPAHLPDLLGDRVRLQQVLRNLLGNAVRFTPTGGCAIISARLLPAPSDEASPLIEVCVRDSGVGIAPEYHERVFESFFQVPRREGGRTSGQGLGLTVVKLIVEQHGGHVRIESALEEGCAVFFTLETARPSEHEKDPNQGG